MKDTLEAATPALSLPVPEVEHSHDGEIRSALFSLTKDVARELDRLCPVMRCDPLTEMDQVLRAVSQDSDFLGNVLDRVPRVRCTASSFTKVAMELSQATISRAAGSGVSRHGFEAGMPLAATLLAWRDLDGCGSSFVAVKH